MLGAPGRHGLRCKGRHRVAVQAPQTARQHSPLRRHSGYWLLATGFCYCFFPMLRFETAGESHGECLVATLTGLPAGVPVSLNAINRDLWRRQQGFGRGGRMKIETDRAHIVSGVRHSKTIGSPVAIVIANADWKNWTEALPVEDFEGSAEKQKRLTRPRPGHADLAGAIKYNFHDARYVLERASARETTARVAVGGLAKAFLGELGIAVLSHVIAVGHERLDRPVTWDELVELNQRD